MSNKREESPLNIYHIYNRGNNKENIFKTDEEKELFISFMNQYIADTTIKIHCSSIMNNHLHYILEAPLDAISVLMKLVQEKYAKYYNMWHNRTGHVFERRFGSNPVFNSKQFTDLFRYISHNAVKAGITDEPYSYKWCSISNKCVIINLARRSEILRFFKLEGLNMFDFLKNKSDERISCFDKKNFTLEEAIDFFTDQIMRFYLHNCDYFLDSPSDIIEKVIKVCRYYGITINQMQKITGLSYFFIRRNSPSSEDYI